MITYTLLQEEIRYWKDIATQQNDCIVDQSKRYDKVLKELKETKAPQEVSVRTTELEVVNADLMKSNKELDNMLASYEDSYKVSQNKVKKLTKDNEEYKVVINEMGFILKKEKAMTSLLLEKLDTFNINHNIQPINRPITRKQQASLNIPKSTNDTYTGGRVKIEIDGIGNYKVKL